MSIHVPTPAHLLIHTVSIKNITWGAESTSGTPEAATNVIISVAAFVQPISAADSMQYGRDTTVRLYNVYLDVVDADNASYSIKAGDEITYGSKVCRVVQCDADLCEVGALKRAVVEFIQ